MVFGSIFFNVVKWKFGEFCGWMYDFGFIVGVFWVVVFECGVFGVKFGKLVIVVNEVMNKIVDGKLKRVFFFVKFDMC